MMLTRIRWFIYGAVCTIALTLMVVKRARAMRERLDAQGVARVAASYGADVIEATGRILKDSVPQPGDGPNG